MLPHFSPCRHWIALVASFATLFARTGNTVAEDAPNASEIVEQLSSWRQSFATVRIRWHSWHRQNFIEANPGLDPDKALGKTDYTEFEFTWSDQGAHRTELKVIKGGTLVYRDLWGTDGPRPWGAVTKRNAANQEELALITFYRPHPSLPLSTNMNLHTLRGLWDSSGKWLDERMRNVAAPTLQAAFGDCDGIRCVRVAVPTGSPDTADTNWLDPNHGLLPRKTEVWMKTNKGNLELVRTWVVTEFGKPDGGVWWPMKGRQLEVGRGDFDWHVEELIFNESLPRSYFAAPTGTRGKTRVIDYLNNNVTQVGADDNTPKSPVIEERPSSTAASTKAIPPSGRWVWLLIASLMLLCIAVTLRLVHRHRS